MKTLKGANKTRLQERPCLANISFYLTFSGHDATPVAQFIFTHPPCPQGASKAPNCTAFLAQVQVSSSTRLQGGPVTSTFLGTSEVLRGGLEFSGKLKMDKGQRRELELTAPRLSSTFPHGWFSRPLDYTLPTAPTISPSSLPRSSPIQRALMMARVSGVKTIPRLQPPPAPPFPWRLPPRLSTSYQLPGHPVIGTPLHHPTKWQVSDRRGRGRQFLHQASVDPVQSPVPATPPSANTPLLPKSLILGPLPARTLGDISIPGRRAGGRVTGAKQKGPDTEWRGPRDRGQEKATSRRR